MPLDKKNWKFSLSPSKTGISLTLAGRPLRGGCIDAQIKFPLYVPQVIITYRVLCPKKDGSHRPTEFTWAVFFNFCLWSLYLQFIPYLIRRHCSFRQLICSAKSSKTFVVLSMPASSGVMRILAETSRLKVYIQFQEKEEGKKVAPNLGIRGCSCIPSVPIQ